MAQERIQRILAAAGVASRRECEDMVRQGRVRVDGRVFRELPLLVDPENDRITVDGKPIRPKSHVYLLVNKPPGFLCAMQAPQGRKCLADLINGPRGRLMPIGKLETEAAGLVVVTSDTVLAQALSNRRRMPARVYRVEVDGGVDERALRRLHGGAWVDEARVAPEKVELVHRQRDRAVLEITLRGGGHRELSRMLFKAGHRSRRVTCIAMGRLTIRGLSAEGVRMMSPEEIESLKKSAQAADHAPRHSRTSPRAIRRPVGRKPAVRGPRHAPGGTVWPQPGRGSPSPRPRLRRDRATRMESPVPTMPESPAISAGPIEHAATPDELQTAIAPHAAKRRIILPEESPRPGKRPRRRRA